MLSKFLLNIFSFTCLCNSFSNTNDNAPVIDVGRKFSAYSGSSFLYIGVASTFLIFIGNIVLCIRLLRKPSEFIFYCSRLLEPMPEYQMDLVKFSKIAIFKLLVIESVKEFLISGNLFADFFEILQTVYDIPFLTLESF